MREHYYLYSIVRHGLGHALVRGDHPTAEVLIFTFYSKRAATIPNPVSEFRGRILTEPGNKELQNLFIFDGVAVGRVSDEYVRMLD